MRHPPRQGQNNLHYGGGPEGRHDLGYPVLVRPSYVLGGQGMEIAYNDRNIEEFMRIINLTVQEHPILVDKYLMGPGTGSGRRVRR